MTTGEILIALFEAYKLNDEYAFMKAAATLIEEEKQKNHYVLANKLKKTLTTSSSINNKPFVNKINEILELPKDKDDGADLVKIIYPQKTFDDIVLSSDIIDHLEDIILENKKKDIIKSFGLLPKKNILFCGPPGCGKTLCAEVLASSLDLPILYTCFDGLISSYLGETATNIRKVFNFASKNNWVLFFDEFDAIGKSRDSIDEHSELKRVVNSFLQILDGFKSDSLVIAATNNEKLIDSALWRRFDDILIFNKPNIDQIQSLIKKRLQAFPVENLDLNKYAIQLLGCSYSDIERICLESIKYCLINGYDYITNSIFNEKVEYEKKRADIIRKIGE